MLSYWWRPRGGSSALLRGVLCVYVLAASLLPLTHHDVACHVKSATHCTTCVVGAASGVASAAGGTGDHSLVDAGAVAGPARGVPSGTLAGACSGRSPPAL